jgi:hypothetical protein
MEAMLMVVTLVSLGLAVVMSVVGWRLLSGERRRSAARVEALESEALSTEGPEWDGAGLFAAAPEVASSAPPNRRWAAVAAVAVLMIGGAGTVFALYRSPDAGGRTGASPVARLAKPLELLSLRHAADADGSFSVTGLVQNPADGRPLTGVVAVIYLFDREGNYFASGRSSLELLSLQPGDESPFVVHVPAGSNVARYRVTFRRDDGAVMPHVDRRTSQRSEKSGESDGSGESFRSGEPDKSQDSGMPKESGRADKSGLAAKADTSGGSGE